MKIILSQKMKSVIIKELKKIILDLVRDSDFSFNIRDILNYRYLSSFTGQYKTTLIIKIETNNRALLLGQFVDLKKGGMRGFHNEYLYGKIEDILIPIIGRRFIGLDIHFEVIPLQNSLNYVYKTISYNTALNMGFISSKSKLANIMRKYELTKVLIAGCEISGPIYGMIKGIEMICETRKINRCLDMFSGTGSLAKVVLDKGASFVDCIENDNINSISETLKDHNRKYKIFNMDAYAFNPQVKYDLLILDPFYDYTLNIAQVVLPRFKNFVKYVVFNVGLEIQHYWTSQIIDSIQQKNFNVDYKKIGENIIAFIETKNV